MMLHAPARFLCSDGAVTMMLRIAFLVAETAAGVLCLALQEAATPAPAASTAPKYGAIEEVIAFERFQPTGIAVSKSGRIFVNFPKWSDDYQFAVVEVLKDGTVKPFPDENWNSGEGSVTSPSDVGDKRERPRSSGEKFV